MSAESQTYYTIGAESLLAQGFKTLPEGDTGIRLHILLDIQPVQTAALLELLNKRGDKFLFGLPSSIAGDPVRLKALLPACYLLLSLDLYAAPDAPFIPVMHERTGEADYSDNLQAYFKEQGIMLSVPVLNVAQAGVSETDDCSFVLYRTAGTEIFHPGRLPVIVTFDPPAAGPDAWYRLIREVQSILPTDTNAKNVFEQKYYEAEIARWEKRALLYRHFLQLSKQVQEQEYYEVIDWYNHEYEILPLWYKQTGHIIKVLMGKRSFRSLFSDNVKKYKD